MKKIVALVLSLVMALSLATVAFAAPAAMTMWDLDADGEWKIETWLTPSVAAETDFADLAADDEHYLPCYEIVDQGGSPIWFVEVPEAAATYKLVYGTQTLFLARLQNNASVYFDVEADVFTNVSDDAEECGALYIANLDEDDTYYASYSKTTKSYTYYVKVSTNNDVVLLVDGKLVKADIVKDGAENAQLNGHDWVGNDVVNYQYTTVICTDCGKVAPLYANATAAGKYAVKTAFGWITLADATDFGAVVEAPEATDKVESAQTFDAGIAMYVGMSVMAAAGSAVVLKKKD